MSKGISVFKRVYHDLVCRKYNFIAAESKYFDEFSKARYGYAFGFLGKHWIKYIDESDYVKKLNGPQQL